MIGGGNVKEFIQIWKRKVVNNFENIKTDFELHHKFNKDPAKFSQYGVVRISLNLIHFHIYKTLLTSGAFVLGDVTLSLSHIFHLLV